MAWARKLHDSPQWQQSLKRFAWTDAFSAGDEFKALLACERDRVKQVVTELGLNGG